MHGSWFARLRRERRLFAATGILSLLFALLQPVATAAAPSVPGGLVLCTTLGIVEREGEERRNEAACPLCVAGHLCAAPVIADTAGAPPPPGPCETHAGKRLSPRSAGALSAGGAGTPPPIRAPPPLR